ncbi:MAG: class I SAM-dependent methyltransferase [Actinobacteria bacterium]|nr:class I SAM-dependent methyltransferase [Actinomycetota bacterium]
MSDQRAVVRSGYDALGPRFDEWGTSVASTHKRDHVIELMDELPDGSSVLDLGCGPGRRVAGVISERHDYLGVDFSQAQLDVARVNAPRARFVRADMTEVAFTPESFDAVVAFYSIIHVPRDEQAALIGRIATWLRPDGLFVACFGTRNEADGSDDWIDGVRMFWSSFEPDTTTQMVQEAGFRIERAQLLENVEDVAVVTFLWVRARKC